MGNRTSQTAPSGQTLYAYDGNNRLTQAGAVVYSYDPNGNLTGTSAGQSFTYDPFNRMTQAVGAGGAATYTYNGDGLKIQRVGPDGALLPRRIPAHLGDRRRRMILPASLDSIA